MLNIKYFPYGLNIILIPRCSRWKKENGEHSRPLEKLLIKFREASAGKGLLLISNLSLGISEKNVTHLQGCGGPVGECKLRWQRNCETVSNSVK